jgi:hypothetical protein
VIAGCERSFSTGCPRAVVKTPVAAGVALKK